MNEPIRLTGLRADSPAAALALYGIAHLLGDEVAVRWAPGDGCAEVLVGYSTVDELCERLVEAVQAAPFRGLADLAKDVNEVTPQQWDAHASPGTPAARLLEGLCAEAPPRDGGRTALTPLCVYSFGTRGTLFGNAVKQDVALDVKTLRALLTSTWVTKRDCNTLGLDPGARRQDGAIMGPDPSADGVRGVPGLVPLALRGLGAVAPMPHRTRAGGGAFRRDNGKVQFLWPVFTVAASPAMLPAIVARDWLRRTAAQRAAAGVEAVYAADILRAERRLSFGRRIA